MSILNSILLHSARTRESSVYEKFETRIFMFQNNRVNVNITL